MANFTELDRYLFAQATHYDIYKKLGAHPCVQNGSKGVCFDLWAPNAKRVWIIGTFNNWDEQADEMERLNVNADISYGNHSLDAKSLMGILTVDFGRVLELRINEDDELCDRIIGRIAEYLV